MSGGDVWDVGSGFLASQCCTLRVEFNMVEEYGPCLINTLKKFFFFLGLHPRHMEVPRLGVELELQPLAYTTATAMLDPG